MTNFIQTLFSTIILILSIPMLLMLVVFGLLYMVWFAALSILLDIGFDIDITEHIPLQMIERD